MILSNLYNCVIIKKKLVILGQFLFVFNSTPLPRLPLFVSACPPSFCLVLVSGMSDSHSSISRIKLLPDGLVNTLSHCASAALLVSVKTSAKLLLLVFSEWLHLLQGCLW